MTVKLHTPCLLSCMKEIETPRYMRIKRIFDWDKNVNMRTVTYDEISKMPLFDSSVMGTKNSPTIVLTSFTMPKKEGGVMLEGDSADMAKQLFEMIEEKHVLG